MAQPFELGRALRELLRGLLALEQYRPSGCGDTVHSREAVVATATRRATMRVCSTTLWGILTLGGGVWIYPDFVAEAHL